MKLFYAILVAMLFASPVYAQDVNSQVVEQNAAFEKAYASHDFKALGDLYTEDAIVYYQGSEILKGREEIQKLWKSYEKDTTDAKFTPIEVIDAGDYAVLFGKSDIIYQGKPDQGRYMTVWKRDNGTWKIVRDTWYSNPTQ